MTDTTTTKKQVLIVGGGFGGVKAALELCKHSNLAVTLLSDQTDFRYYPALYHTATGGSHVQSHIPLARILDEKRTNIVQGTAEKIDRAQKVITTTDGRVYHYDVLVLALGVVSNYFGIDGLEQYSYGIKSWEQIKRFKQHLHQLIQDEGKPDLNYLIVGAGPTGIELAGALPEYLKKIMRGHKVKGHSINIEIIEAAPRLLPRSSEKVSEAVAKRLEKLNIKLRLGQAVQGQTADSLMVSGQPIESRTVVWTAGTSNHPFFKDNGFKLTDRGKVEVNEFLQAEDSIYVIGDNANTQFSGMAQTALRDGLFAAQDIMRHSNGEQSVPYEPKQPVSVIPVGDKWAAVEWGKRSFSGKIGWLLRQAADWIGFHDLEPWWRASEQWMTEFDTEEDCPECAPGAGKVKS